MKESTAFKRAVTLYEQTLLKKIYRAQRKKSRTKSLAIELTALEAGLGVKKVWEILKNEK